MHKLALCCPMICLMLWPEYSFAYRPFDATDAAVADLGELEIELGPVEFRRSEAERTVIAPAYVLNYGFAKNWELVVEGQAEDRKSTRLNSSHLGSSDAVVCFAT